MSKMSSIEVCVFINLNHFDCILKSSPGTVTSVCRSIWRDECPIMTMPRSSSSPRRKLTGQIHIVRLTMTAAAANDDDDQSLWSAQLFYCYCYCTFHCALRRYVYAAETAASASNDRDDDDDDGVATFKFKVSERDSSKHIMRLLFYILPEGGRWWQGGQRRGGVVFSWITDGLDRRLIDKQTTSD